MSGTVVQNPRDKAEVFYFVVLNMVSGQAPLINTNYKFDRTGIVVCLPYYEYSRVSETVANMNNQ